MLELITALIIFLFPLAYSPGPGNTFFAALGARSGISGTLPALGGYHIATLVVTLLIGLGFVEITNRFPEIFVIIKYAGAAYVLWLAWKFYRAGSSDVSSSNQSASFFDGAILLLLNPKAYLIIALMFTQFLDPGISDSPIDVLLISIIFTLNNLIAFTIWALVGDTLGRLFRNERHAQKLNIFFALLLASVAFWMALR